MEIHEIVDTLLVSMAARESVVITLAEIKTIDIEKAQDVVIQNNGANHKNNAAIQGLEFLKNSGKPMTLANYEWIVRLGL